METSTATKLQCYCCKSEYDESDSFCGTCGFPLKGTHAEQKKFSINYANNRHDKQIIEKQVREARIVLFVIAAFTVLQGFIQYYKEASGILLMINLILAVIYAGLGFWAGYRAFAAIFTGLLIYLSIIILNAVFVPLSILSGLLLKIIFIAAFIKASYGAYKFKVDKV
jgi:hypothetical protein